MTTAIHDIDSTTAVRRVNDTLRGPVAAVLGRLMPDFKGMERDAIYERALDDLDTLSRSFQMFREQRRHFRYIVVDGRNRPVSDDTEILSCGRSVEDVIAMVVRTAAKRYFRRHLDNEPSGVRARVPALGRRRRSPADELYDAIKDYLMHEWQVPLVPAYADMSPGLVRALGARLLDIRDLAALHRLIKDPDEIDRLDQSATPAAAAAPDREGAASESERVALLLSLDGQHLRAEAFFDVLVRDEVRAHMPPEGRSDKAFAILRGTGGVPARLLLSGLKLSADQLAVVLLNAHAAVGPQVYARLFGQPGQPELVLRMVQQAMVAGIDAGTSLGVCASFIRNLFTRAAGGAPGGPSRPASAA